MQRRREIRGDTITVKREPQEEGYHFRDFASVIETDPLGKDITKAINDEIQHKLDIKRIY